MNSEQNNLDWTEAEGRALHGGLLACGAKVAVAESDGRSGASGIGALERGFGLFCGGPDLLCHRGEGAPAGGRCRACGGG